jgi:hypothetical protein
MPATDKDSATNLAMAFLRKAATRSRFEPIVRREVETDTKWVFDFFHPRWHGLRRKNAPYGVRIAVDKRTGKAEHYATLQQNNAA